jgi:hypothetical protein
LATKLIDNDCENDTTVYNIDIFFSNIFTFSITVNSKYKNENKKRNENEKQRTKLK